MSRFFLNIEDIKGTNAERNVERVIAKGKQATLTYDLKDKQQKFNKSRDHYTQEQYDFIREELKEMLYFFGYVNTPNNKDNPLGFYDYEEHDPDLLASVNGYQKQNED